MFFFDGGIINQYSQLIGPCLLDLSSYPTDVLHFFFFEWVIWEFIDYQMKYRTQGAQGFGAVVKEA